ncbi:MAG TPA: glycosyltransferase [Patescibacteria group bacterium]|nr:glycosyltransferase [Patescibacteria group bacterium]
MQLEIIMFNMSGFSEWQKGISNRNYQVFKKLTAHPNVKRIIAVDFLPYTLKRAARNWLENILYPPLSGQRGSIENVYKGAFSRMVKVNGYNSEVYVFSTINSLISDKLTFWRLNKLLKKDIFKTSDNTKRVIWSYFPMTVDYFNNIDSDLTVFDAVDNWIYHESFGKYKELLRDNYNTIAQKSDLIFTVSNTLVDFFKKMKRKNKVHWISNGIETKRFKDAKPLSGDELPFNIKRPIIGYIGTIQNRFRVDLLEHLAIKNPNKSFLIVGPIWGGLKIKDVLSLRNVYTTGRVSYKDAPRYIKTFDACIIPHKVNRFVTYTNSLKVLEYLACNKPVVSTPSSGVERFSDNIEIKKDKKEFNQALQKVLSPGYKNKLEKNKKNLSKFDWKIKVDKMVNIILQNLK